MSTSAPLPLNLSLYCVVDPLSFAQLDDLVSKVQSCIEGGVTCVQLRDHQSDFDALIKIATHLQEKLSPVPLVINAKDIKTSCAVAEKVGAAGVFLEEASACSEARNLLGEKKTVGVFARTKDNLIEMGRTGWPDYISIKVFASSGRTCSDTSSGYGMDGLREMRTHLPPSVRVVAVGGLNPERVRSVYRELYAEDGVALASGLTAEENPCTAARTIKESAQAIVRKAPRRAKL